MTTTYKQWTRYLVESENTVTGEVLYEGGRTWAPVEKIEYAKLFLRRGDAEKRARYREKYTAFRNVRVREVGIELLYDDPAS